ncbi:uncharacterized protein METZ01_LOCUS39917 [marine metagenome]|uniref:Uncharacterized protein n=1 Tax=marine metagenome TaxID=408172 RepID=A0A381RCM7_9ZZZZ
MIYQATNNCGPIFFIRHIEMMESGGLTKFFCESFPFAIQDICYHYEGSLFGEASSFCRSLPSCASGNYCCAVF